MKIVINSIVYRPSVKIGVGVYVSELARALAATFPEHEFVVFTDPKDPALEAASANLRTLAAPIRPTPSFRQVIAQSWISRTLRQLDADLYHLPNTAPMGRFRVPSAVTIHDLQEFATLKYSPLRGTYRKVANWIAARRASVIITVSENSRRDICRYLGIGDEKVFVTHLAAPGNFRPAEQETARRHVRKAYGLERFALCVGALNPAKILQSLLEAFRMISPEMCQTLAFAGPHIDVPGEFQRKVDMPSLSGRIRMLGYVGDDDLRMLYSSCEMLVYPSLYEGFGLPPLEAMACGAPVVASRNSSIPEVVGNAGILVDPLNCKSMAQGMIQVLIDPVRRKSLVESGLRRSAEFTWEATARRTMIAYQRALGPVSLRCRRV